jgi:hypothetical protein
MFTQLTPDGLPSPTALKVTIPKLFKNFTNLFEPSLLTCEKLYNEQYKAWEGIQLKNPYKNVMGSY